MDRNAQVLAVLVAACVSATSVSAESHYGWSGPYAGAALSFDSFRTDANDYWCWHACDAPGNASVEYQAAVFAG